jgi:hypothetical protein
MIAALAFRRHPLAPVGPVYLWVGVLPAAGAVVGSLIVWGRWGRRRVRPVGMPRWTKVTCIVVSHLVLFAGGVYVGRTAATRTTSFEGFPSALAHLSPAAVDAQLRADLSRFKTVAAGLGELERNLNAFQSQLNVRRTAEERDYYLPEEDEQLRWLFVTYLSYRAALLRLVATYSGFEAVREPDARARCFMLGHAAAATTFETGLKLVHEYRDEPVVRRKLNEAEQAWGIPAGMFDRIYESIAASRNLELCEEMAAHFDHKNDLWREAEIWPAEDFDWLAGRIEEALQYVRANPLAPRRMRLDLFIERVKQDAYTPAYAAQSMVAEWIGDTRIVQRPPFVSTEQIKELQAILRPGDILLERRNWFLSNAFLPGFWPHAALYVGGIDDLRELGITDDPAVRERLSEYLTPAPDGEPNTVIEAVSEGVIFNSLTESMHADYVAVLRPRLSKQDIARAIATAFRHQGKPYDFEFDFFTSDELVCTELVYRSYEGMLHFELKQVMGRATLPAVEIGRKFADERSGQNRELDLILFLDADAATGRAVPASEEEFSRSVDRPPEFNE